VQKHPRGFAFLIPEDKSQPDAYLDEEQAAQLLQDDVVEYRLHHARGRTQAELVRVVSRSRTQVVGRLRFHGRDRALALVTAEGEFFELAERPRGGAGDFVTAAIVEYPTAKRVGLVRVTENLGAELTPAHDVKVACARFGIPERFESRVEREAEDGLQRMETEVQKGRRVDLRDRPFVTVDGEDAKDYDDAIWVERTDAGFRLHVAIADVAFFVRPGTALDDSARDRGTSVYFPGVCVPMLPERLSNDLCSLRPRENKLAMVATMEFDRRGNPKGYAFQQAIIRTAMRLTYAKVQKWIDGDPEVRRELAFLDEPLKAARDLYKRRLDQREARGVLDFDLPETKVHVDERGRPIAVMPAPRYETHRWIEEFMIAANQAVAHALRSRRLPTLYRIHEEPSEDAIEEANRKLKALGFAQRVETVEPKAFAKVLRELQGKPGGDVAHFTLLRSQKQAHYGAEPLGHFGLALKDYAHFTSPIRRYPDLVVHRALKRFMDREKLADNDREEELEEMAELGDLTSSRERRATEAERFVVRRKQCWFFLPRIGEVFSGRVSGTTPRGLFVTLGDTSADGFLPADALEGQWSYDEERGRWSSRSSGQSLSLGSPLTVAIRNVSVDEGQIEVAWEHGVTKDRSRRA
jgi:ribonuclease R